MQLGLLGKHSSSRLLSSTIYQCIINLSSVKSGSKQWERIMTIFQNIPEMEMICYFGNTEMDFSTTALQASRLENSISHNHLLNIPLIDVKGTFLEKGLQPLGIDDRKVPEVEYKEEKKIVTGVGKVLCLFCRIERRFFEVFWIGLALFIPEMRIWVWLMIDYF